MTIKLFNNLVNYTNNYTKTGIRNIALAALIWALVMGAFGALLAMQPTAASASGGGDLPRFYGLITSRPSGNVGNWVLGDRTFVADGSTEFNFQFGPLNVGICAQAKYVSASGVDTAVEIESQPASDCGPDATGTPDGTVTPSPSPSSSPSPSPSGTVTPSPSSTPDPVSSNRAYGILSAFPASRTGVWTIGGVNYTATGATEFKQENGTFAVNGCVKVKYYISAGQNQAIEIETENASDCTASGSGSIGDDSSSGQAKVQAPIDSLPASPFVGNWVLGGVSYQANSGTRFEQQKGNFAAGVCVEARYTVSSGVNLLSEVESTEAYKCQGAIGANLLPVFHSYGVVQTFPQNLVGSWRVSNITYTANSSTTFEQPHGQFAVGAFVEVKYQVISGTLIAVKIETHVAPQAGLGNSGGSLDTRPSDDWGAWVINGQTYQGDHAMEVKLGDVSGNPLRAPSAITSTVIVNYYIADGVRYATSVRQLTQHIMMPLVVK